MGKKVALALALFLIASPAYADYEVVLGEGAPTTNSSFGRSDGYDTTVQSFLAVGDDVLTTITLVNLWVASGPTSDAVVIAVQEDDGANHPSGSDLAVSGSQDINGITSCGTEFTFTFPSPASLTDGSKYWLVLRRTGSLTTADRYIVCDGNTDTYADGAKYNHFAGTGNEGYDTTDSDWYAVLNFVPEEEGGDGDGDGESTTTPMTGDYNGPSENEWLFVNGVLIFVLSISMWPRLLTLRKT